MNTKFFILIALTKIHKIKSQQNLMLRVVPKHAITVIDPPPRSMAWYLYITEMTEISRYKR